MSNGPASRGNRITELSLADVLAAVQCANLPDRRRQEMASALRTVARALGKPLVSVPADARRLSDRLKQVSPRAIGISPGRWNNIRSHVRGGLALVQRMAPGRHLNNLSPAWEALWRQLDSRPVKIALSRFLRFCSAQGIEPEAVTEATFAAFRADLDNTLLKNPDKVFAALARGWRMAQIAVDSWPRVSVSAPDRRNRWTLPLTSFPESFRQDCKDWCDRLAGRDLLEEMSFRPARPITVEHRKFQIRSFASALVLRGRDPSTITSLRDLVEIEAFKEGLKFLIERRGGRSTSAISHLARSLKAIARHHLHLDRDYLDKLGAIIRRLESGRRGLTETNRARLRQLDDLQNLEALLRLPRDLMANAARNQRPHSGAVEAQIAVAIEILTMAPMRIGNLVTLDLERNLVRPGRGGAMHLVIEPEEVKNSEPLDYPLPPQSIELIERYLREFRPRLAPGRSTALFPGRGGGPKVPRGFAEQISDTIHSYTGMRINVHLFRHIAAKLYLDANPGGYEVVRRVLGQRSINTTVRFYTGLETASAVRHFDATILSLRKEPNAR
jgi:integrase